MSDGWGIRIYDENNREICMIQVMGDGEPTKKMYEVVEFLAVRDLVNGYSHSDDINGMEDLVAQIVTFLKLKYYFTVKKFVKYKDRPRDKIYRMNSRDKIYRMIIAGAIYVLPPGSPNRGEWEYHIKYNGSSVMIEVYKYLDEESGFDRIWHGSPKEYLEFFSI
ncbi:MAG: hypothetical protein QXN08_08885 [Nitrososphaerales archaeon]